MTSKELFITLPYFYRSFITFQVITNQVIKQIKWLYTFYSLHVFRLYFSSCLKELYARKKALYPWLYSCFSLSWCMSENVFRYHHHHSISSCIKKIFFKITAHRILGQSELRILHQLTSSVIVMMILKLTGLTTLLSMFLYQVRYLVFNLIKTTTKYISLVWHVRISCDLCLSDNILFCLHWASTTR